MNVKTIIAFISAFGSIICAVIGGLACTYFKKKNKPDDKDKL